MDDRDQVLGQTFLQGLELPPAAVASDTTALPSGASCSEVIASAMMVKAMRGDIAAAKFVLEMASKALPESARKTDPFELRLVVVDDGD